MEGIIRPRKASIVLGVCVLEAKAFSRRMSKILDRLQARTSGAIIVTVFGNDVIYNAEVSNWPLCDVLICYYSAKFPTSKAMSYIRLRKPFCINDFPSQELLRDRRLVVAILDRLGIPTPERIEVSRDGGPKASQEMVDHMIERFGIELEESASPPPEVILRGDGKAIMVGDQVMEKPFVEKPVSGKDHNVYVYYSEGGGRKIFHKVSGRRSEMAPDLVHPRTEGSYIYETCLTADNSEDIKVYTVGNFIHAESRKSPVVDGAVKTNTAGNEIRPAIPLTEDEKKWAKKISAAFGQAVCGLDMLRFDNGHSVVIDVNGWRFGKGNDDYFDMAADALAELCFEGIASRELPVPIKIPRTRSSSRICAYPDSPTSGSPAPTLVKREEERHCC